MYALLSQENKSVLTEVFDSMLVVFRLGHRPFRDQRISTHCGLVSRALGADKIIYSGEKDDSFEKSVNGVAERFGGRFKIGYSDSWKKTIHFYKKKKFSIVHLTVYGLPIQKQISKIRKSRNLLLIIGGEKVPWEIYQLADCNISVTSQPHSEVAALAIFLDRYFSGKELGKKFPGKIKIIPEAKGKNVEKN